MSTDATVGASGRWRVRTNWLDTDADLLTLLPDDAGHVWLHEGEGMVAWGLAHRVIAPTGDGRMRAVASELDACWADADVDDPVGLPGGGRLAFASFTFDHEAPGSSVVVPRRIVGRDARGTWQVTIDADAWPTVAHITREPLQHHTDRVRFAGSSQPDVHYLDAVATATARISVGEVDKVVLARDHAVWSKSPFGLRALARRLADRFPTCWTFAAEGLVGASPELLVRRRGDHVASLALAGTAARDDDPELDEKLLDELRESDKMRREHEPAATSVVEALRPCTDELHRGELEVVRLANVQHLATRVTGRLTAPAAGVLELVARLHPTAAVGGVPTGEAVRLIRELEGMDRGRYAGPVGWVSADGDGEFVIALRCGEFSGARARLFAGAGIVAGSLPEDELLETRLKLRAMQEALS